jgi:putative intracellular protease/amidase
MIKEIQHYVHAHGMPKRGKVLMVASSPTVSAQTQWPIGFWAAELIHPLLKFQEAGLEVVIASTEGGAIQMDAYSDPRDASGYSAHDIISWGYLQQQWFRDLLLQTTSIDEVSASDFDALFLVGGQAPMYTFRGNKRLENLFLNFHKAGKPTAAVCHATCILLDLKEEEGKLLVEGKTWTGFADAEEDFADAAVGRKIQPFRIEEEARKISGTDFRVATPFSAYAIADGNLITGQQQNSGAAAAHLVIQQLRELFS